MKINVDEKGIAIHGYDPVAYFVDKKPVAGKPSLSHQWSGAIWLFSTTENRQDFINTPEKYAPQFGGFCAYAASSGAFADTEPDAWSIVNNKLYLNFNTSVRGIWNSNRKEFIKRAEEHWPKMNMAN
jgi:YHS domain-containing protein